MTEDTGGSGWGLLAFAGICGICCISLGTLFGGAALVGGTAAGVTASSGVVQSLGGLVFTGIATAIPLVVLGFILRRKARGS